MVHNINFTVIFITLIWRFSPLLRHFLRRFRPVYIVYIYEFRSFWHFHYTIIVLWYSADVRIRIKSFEKACLISWIPHMNLTRLMLQRRVLIVLHLFLMVCNRMLNYPIVRQIIEEALRNRYVVKIKLIRQLACTYSHFLLLLLFLIHIYRTTSLRRVFQAVILLRKHKILDVLIIGLGSLRLRTQFSELYNHELLV